ncbi:unnamed protein product [Didymodactylos carnosus]|uniref:Uncharacterized protein n=1 Tax=Didymodactylos carnosus TaxID=1234261 RepID=A0A814DYL8_9BILA|nr:unnamed protein product [Didymodactylos carnosus]CAF0962219.1 unnamed protein product [Didymodactylos carnosus]CAF3582104.1 unnamed protein product [Didymodactylos carnosus]CAF3736639.1 unnamed protein product [Didymodactylos carnosus]
MKLRHKDRELDRVVYLPVENSCTASLGGPITLLYMSNAAAFAYTYHSFNYVATSYQATLSLAFRQDPSWWCLDDIAVTYGGVNSFQNGGFETGALGTSYTFCNPQTASSSGTVSTTCPHTGSYSYYDGSVTNPDYISQTFAVVSGRTYVVSFWIRNMGGPTNSATIIIGT